MLMLAGMCIAGWPHQVSLTPHCDIMPKLLLLSPVADEFGALQQLT